MRSITAYPKNWTQVERWFPCDYNRGPNILVWIGLLSSFAAVFIKLWTPTSINRIPEALYTLPFVFVLLTQYTRFIQDRLIQLLGLAVALPLLFFLINYVRDANLALEYYSIEKLSKLFFFIPIAWWLGGRQRAIGIYLLSAFLGLIVASAFSPDTVNVIEDIKNGIRIDFGILNAQHVALYYSVSVIGVLAYSTNYARAATSSYNIKVLWILFYLVSILICTIIILATQTRAAWLALVACAAVAFIHRGIPGWSKGVVYRASAILTALILSFTLVAAFNEPIKKRLFQESETFKAVLYGQWETIPYTSSGIRLNTWIEAADWVSERPLIGWGGAVRHDVISQSNRLPEEVKQNYGHFHNSYIEFTLAYGLFGLSVVVMLFLLILKQGYSLSISEPSIRPLWHFTSYSILLIAIMNFFESYLFFWSGVYIVSIVLAPLYSCLLTSRLSKFQ